MDIVGDAWVYDVVGKVIENAIMVYAKHHKRFNRSVTTNKKGHTTHKIYRNKIDYCNYESAKAFLFSRTGGLSIYINFYGIPLDINNIRGNAKVAADIGINKMKDKYSFTGKTDNDREIEYNRRLRGGRGLPQEDYDAKQWNRINYDRDDRKAFKVYESDDDRKEANGFKKYNLSLARRISVAEVSRETGNQAIIQKDYFSDRYTK